MRSLIFILMFALGISAAYAKGPEKSPLIKTEYFTIELPKGWSMPAPIKEQPLGGLSAAFVKEGSDIAVTLNFLHGNIPAREFAAKMSQDIRKSGMKTSSPVARGSLYTFSLNGQASGTAWIGSENGICAATLIFGGDLKAANRLLKAVQGKYRKLLPSDAG